MKIIPNFLRDTDGKTDRYKLIVLLLLLVCTYQAFSIKKIASDTFSVADSADVNAIRAFRMARDTYDEASSANSNAQDASGNSSDILSGLEDGDYCR